MKVNQKHIQSKSSIHQHAVWCLDENYLACCMVSVYSFYCMASADCIKDTDFVFLVDKDSTLTQLSDFLDILGVQYQIFVIGEIANDMHFDKRLSAAASYRLFIPEFIASGRVAYFDCDTMAVNMYSDSIFDLDMQGSPIMAKRDLEAAWFYSEESMNEIRFDTPKKRLSYFNDGVMLIDFDGAEASCLFSDAMSYLAFNAYKHGEQDALNVAFEGRWKPLPNAYNLFTERDSSFWGFDDKPHFVHFTMDRNKPWLSDHQKDCNHEWCQQWRKYNGIVQMLLDSKTNN